MRDPVASEGSSCGCETRLDDVRSELVVTKLRDAGQNELADYIERKRGEDLGDLMMRALEVDWEELQRPYETPHISAEEVGKADIVYDPSTLEGSEYQRLTMRGQELYRKGAVAAALVAGGQGTRLGHDGPKGTYSIGAVSGTTIFEHQINKLKALKERYGHEVPFLVMTSPATDAPTRTFFNEHKFFGLPSEQIRFFMQGTVPSLTMDGKALLKDQKSLLENPDGHGGFLQAINVSGEVEKLLSSGKEYLVFNQVDNVLSLFDDPLLVGLADEKKADIVVKVVRKVEPDEKMGNLALIGGRPVIVEYTDLTPEHTRLKAADGSFLMEYGSTAMYCFRVEFLKRVYEAGFKPPLHRSKKPLNAYINGETKQIDGYKNERFLHDLLLAEVPMEVIALAITDRDREFAPVKNATGIDSAESARELASQEYKRWLTRVGLPVSDKLVEIAATVAATEEQFAEKYLANPEALKLKQDEKGVLIR